MSTQIARIINERFPEFYTYIHCLPDGVPFYVGKGGGNQRSNNFSRRNVFHKRLVEKVGRKNVSIYVFRCESEQQALQDEIQQIAQLRADGFRLVNLTDGGEGVAGKTVSPETRAKLSAANKGKPLSLECRKRMSESRLGKKKSAIHAKNLWESIKASFDRRGTKASPETLLKMRAAQQARRQKERNANV